MQARFLYGELLQGIGRRRAGDVLARANPALSNLIPIVWMGRTRSGGTVGKVNQLPNFFFQRHLADQFGNALLALTSIQRWCRRGTLRPNYKRTREGNDKTQT